MSSSPLANDEADLRHDGSAWYEVLPFVVLSCVAAWAVLPDLFDVDVFKGAVVALVGAVVVVPLLVLGQRARDDLTTWYASGVGRGLVLVTAISALGALAFLQRAAVVDRLLVFAALQLAALAGLRAARAGLFTSALLVATTPVALVALAQALGWSAVLTPGPEEVVATLGNSTRAGALLALGAPAALLLCVFGGRRPAFVGPALAVLHVAALTLTLARGARLGALVALVAVTVALVVARARGRLPRDQAARLSRTLAGVLVWVVVGVGVAIAVNPERALSAAKLDESAPVLSGRDLTTNVRLSLWDATLDMVADHRLTGVGLGRYVDEFPAYRDPVEAALPGLAGAQTVAQHPHNEVLFVLAEGGLIAGLVLVLVLAATIRRTWMRALEHPDLDDLAATGVLVAGFVVGMVQDAWTTVGTAVPLYAALGFVWSIPWTARHPLQDLGAQETSTWQRWGLRVVAALVALSLVGLAVPRLRAHLGLRAYYQSASSLGGASMAEFEQTFSHLADAADADPTDVTVQQLVVVYGSQALAQAESQAIREAVEEARARLDALRGN